MLALPCSAVAGAVYTIVLLVQSFSTFEESLFRLDGGLAVGSHQPGTGLAVCFLVEEICANCKNNCIYLNMQTNKCEKSLCVYVWRMSIIIITIINA